MLGKSDAKEDVGQKDAGDAEANLQSVAKAEQRGRDPKDAIELVAQMLVELDVAE